jgi:hypothetical protein
MIFYCKLLGFFVGTLFLITGQYQRHKQVCNGVFTVDRKWWLTLNQDKSFVYSIRTINTKAIKKKTNLDFNGKWSVLSDTLRLNFVGNSKPMLLFLLKGDNLIPINHPVDTVGDVVFRLDYLRNGNSIIKRGR